MRTVKFRGKREDNGKWVYGAFVGDYFHSSQHGKMDAIFISEGHESRPVPVFKETVGEFIGYKDHDQKEVFEGDIVTYETDKGDMVTAVIEFQINDDESLVASGFFFRPLFVEEIEHDEVVGFKVIGNRHDNPEYFARATTV